MKKVYLMAGMGCGGLVFATVIAIVVLFVNVFRVNSEAEAYANRVLPVILADLRKEILLEYATEDLKSSATPEEMDKLFAWYQRLGKLERSGPAVGQAQMSVHTATGKVVHGTYTSQAEFTAGSAEVRIEVVRIDEEWFIRSFHINSPIFLEGANSNPPRGEKGSEATASPMASGVE